MARPDLHVRARDRVLRSWDAFQRWVQLAPARVVPLAYAVGWALGTGALALPWSHRGPAAGRWEAAFTYPQEDPLIG